jgi:hypothetical protein
MRGQQRLIGGDDWLACLQRGFDNRFGGAIFAADQFYNQIDVRIAGQVSGIGVKCQTGGVEPTILGLIARRYCGEPQGACPFCAEFLSAGQQKTGERGTNGAEPCNAHTQWAVAG